MFGMVKIHFNSLCLSYQTFVSIKKYFVMCMQVQHLIAFVGFFSMTLIIFILSTYSPLKHCHKHSKHMRSLNIQNQSGSQGFWECLLLINTLFIIFDDVFHTFWLLPWSCSYLISFCVIQDLIVSPEQ